jgi:hypothetical protein
MVNDAAVVRSSNNLFGISSVGILRDILKKVLSTVTELIPSVSNGLSNEIFSFDLNKNNC